MISPHPHIIPRELISYILSIKSYQAWKERLIIIHTRLDSTTPKTSLVEPNFHQTLYPFYIRLISHSDIGTIFADDVTLITKDLKHIKLPLTGPISFSLPADLEGINIHREEYHLRFIDNLYRLGAIDFLEYSIYSRPRTF